MRSDSLCSISGLSLKKLRIVYRVHALKRMFERDISEKAIMTCIEEGRVIEHYSDDLSFPSFLINGSTNHGEPLHVVASINHREKILYIITTYIPDPLKWSNYFSERK